MHTELGGQHTVIGAGAAAALDVTRHHVTGFHTHKLLQFSRDALADAVIGQGGAVSFALLLLHLGFFAAHSAFRHSNDGESLLALGAGFHHLGHFLDVIGNFGQQDHVRTAGNAGIQRQPASLVAHDLDHHAAAVAGGGGMNAVDDLSGDIHSGMEAEGEVGAKDVVVDGLGQADHVETFFAEQVRGLVGTVATQSDKAIQLQVLIGLFHGGDLVHAIFFHHAHVAEGTAAGAQNGAAQRQDTGELLLAHLLILALDQSAITVADTDDLSIKKFIGSTGNATDGCIQAGAIPAAGQNTDFSLHKDDLLFVTMIISSRGFLGNGCRKNTYTIVSLRYAPLTFLPV